MDLQPPHETNARVAHSNRDSNRITQVFAYDKFRGGSIVPLVANYIY